MGKRQKPTVLRQSVIAVGGNAADATEAIIATIEDISALSEGTMSVVTFHPGVPSFKGQFSRTKSDASKLQLPPDGVAVPARFIALDRKRINDGLPAVYAASYLRNRGFNPNQVFTVAVNAMKGIPDSPARGTR